MDETVSRSARPGPVELSRLRAEPAETVLLLVAFAARSVSCRSLGSKPRRQWLAVNAGDEHKAAPSDWMARRGCTPSRMRRSSRRNRRPRALRRGRGLSGNAESPPHVVVRRERRVGAADGDRERVHLAVPSRIESPLLRARRDGAAVGGTRRPQHVEQAVSLKPHRRWLAVGCRRHDAAPPERAVRRRCAPPRMRSRSRDGCRQPAVVGVDRSETSMQAI